MWMPCWSHPPAVILYRRAARVSMGTVFQIPWTRITGFNDDGTENKHYWPFQGIDELKSLGFTTVAMALEDRSISLDELTRRLHAPAEDPTHIDKLALIFGTEGDGLSHHTIARAESHALRKGRILNKSTKLFIASSRHAGAKTLHVRIFLQLLTM